jgi:Tfp pilus assembly ATPase PilU
LRLANQNIQLWLDQPYSKNIYKSKNLMYPKVSMIVITMLMTTIPKLPLLIPQNIIKKVPLNQRGYVILYGTSGAISAKIMAVARAVKAL